MATILISFIKIFKLGPEVSLNGSPTVSVSYTHLQPHILQRGNADGEGTSFDRRFSFAQRVFMFE